MFKTEDVVMTFLIIFAIVAGVGCSVAFVHFFYLALAKIFGFLLGALVGAFVYGYHLLNH